MKVTPAHLAMIRDAIAVTGNDRPDIRERYRNRDIPRGDLVQDIDKRFRWDLFHAANAASVLSAVLYGAGYNDAHIDTALRTVVTPL